jgi:DNA-binding IscR family transcriptional regulator
MRVSDKKREKIIEQILVVLYSNNPKPLFTSKIAEEVARDEEFTKKLLLSLKKKNITIEVKKNPKGVPYLRRSRWILNKEAYKQYKQYQP